MSRLAKGLTSFGCRIGLGSYTLSRMLSIALVRRQGGSFRCLASLFFPQIRPAAVTASGERARRRRLSVGRQPSSEA